MLTSLYYKYTTFLKSLQDLVLHTPYIISIQHFLNICKTWYYILSLHYKYTTFPKSLQDLRRGLIRLVFRDI